MSRTPQSPFLPSGSRRKRETQPVVAPRGHFKRNGKFRLATHRSPENVTKINPEGMKPILPEMPYIPPA